jgi:exopolyphosphatase/guanosine-5'-triphosphate,3'-diphosphate pyrophosphatase
VTRVAAIDMGTNSTRLLIADVVGHGRDAIVTTIERTMMITRLGQGVDGQRRLHPDAVARTLATLQDYGDAIRASGVDIAHVRAVATSAARDAANRDELFDAAMPRLGVRPELISGTEEAELSFLGATAERRGDGAPYLVVDIGGGSTEFVAGTGAPEGSISVDMGCVRITEQFLHSDPPKAEELSVAVGFVRDELGDVEREVPGASRAKTLIGLAGTVSTMAAVELGLAAYDRDQIHGFRLSRDAAEEVFRTLATEASAQRRHNPGLEPGRVDVIVGGAIVVVSVMRHFGFDEMVVSESDILDGLARSIPQPHRGVV